MRSGAQGGALPLCAVLAACAASTPREDSRIPGPVASLAAELRRLGPAVDGEARLVAETALRRAARLARDYRATRPPLLHNLLVRVGLRERGLCCHWTRDLLDELEGLDAGPLRFRWAVAHPGSVLREHNAVVVTTAGGRFEDGVVLDGWRRPGELTVARVATDRYPWQPHPAAAPGTRIDCNR